MGLKRTLTAFYVFGLIIMAAPAWADIISPFGLSRSPRHQIYVPDYNDVVIRQFPMLLTIEYGAPSGSALLFADKNGRLAGKTICGGDAPCRIKINQPGSLYIDPEGMPGGSADISRLIRSDKLARLVTIKKGKGARLGSISCDLEYKGRFYVVMECGALK